MKHTVTWLAAAVLLALPTAGRSADVSREDLQCLLTMGGMQAQPDPKVQRDGLTGALYFLGKLVGANPDIDLPAELASEWERFRGSPAKPLIDRCLGEITARSQQLVAASGRLNQVGE